MSERLFPSGTTRLPLKFALPLIAAFPVAVDQWVTDGMVRDKVVAMAEGNGEASESVTTTDSQMHLLQVEVEAVNEIGEKMRADLTPYQPVDPNWANQEMTRMDKLSHHFGEQISVEDSMRYFYIAGFRGDDLKIITAISRRESGGYPGAVGDWNYKGTGSRSVGTTQIRCITEGDKLPCVGQRAWETNFDPMKSARNTYEMYIANIQGDEYGDHPMGYDGRFQPWVWHKELQEKHGDDPAQFTHLPQVSSRV